MTKRGCLLTAVSLAFGLSAIASAASATSGPSILAVTQIRAHSGEVTLWTATVSGCRIEKIWVEHQRTIRQTWDAAHCTRLTNIQAAERASPSPATASGGRKDEPDYEVTFEGRKFDIEFLAPNDCTVVDAGNLKCTSRKLSPAQELLLVVRAIR